MGLGAATQSRLGPRTIHVVAAASTRPCLVTAQVTNGVPTYACRLVAGRMAWGLGDGLPREELEWIASEVNDQLAQLAEARGERRIAPPA